MKHQQISILVGQLLLVLCVLLPCSGGKAGEAPRARARELQLTVSAADTAVLVGSRLSTTVSVTNVGKRSVRFPWGWVCAKNPVSHDSFIFVMRMGGKVQEKEAFVPSTTNIACRQPLPVFVTLVPGERKDFDYSLDLKKFFEDKTGRLDIEVKYRYEEWGMTMRSKPISIDVRTVPKQAVQ